jgi:hypothetical protein
MRFTTIIMMALLTCASVAPAQSTQPTKADAVATIAAVVDQRDAAITQLKLAASDVAAKVDQINELQTQRLKLAGDLETASKSLNTANAEITNLKAALAAAQKPTTPTTPLPVGYDVLLKPGGSQAAVKPGSVVKLDGDWTGQTLKPVGGVAGKPVTYDLSGVTFAGKGTAQQAIDFRIAAGKWVQYVVIKGGTIRDYDGGSFNHMAVVRHGPNVTIDGLKVTECTGHALGVNDGTGVVWRNLNVSDNYGSPFNGASGKGMRIEDSRFANNNRGHKRQIGKDRCEEINGLGYFKLTYEFAKFAQMDGLTVVRCVFDGTNGQGLWLDPANTNYVIADCVFSNNRGLKSKWEGCGFLSELSLGGGQLLRCKFFGNTGNGAVIAECWDLQGGIATTIIGCTFTSWNNNPTPDNKKADDRDNNNLTLRDMNKPAPKNRKITNFRGSGKDQPMKLFGVVIDSNTFVGGAQVSQGGEGWGKDNLSDRNVILKNNVGLN